MDRFPQGFWGPRFRFAALPILAVAVLVIRVAGSTGPTGQAGATPVTVLKPVSDGIAVPDVGAAIPAGEMPIEVRYGVPSTRTIRFWTRR